MPELDPADQEVLDALSAEGADLTKPTSFVFFVLLRDEAGATSAAERLSADGWGCELVASEAEGFARTLFAERDEVPSPENVARMRAAVEQVAESCDGVYDDWEAAVTT